jgi:hypothetical protein
MHRATLRSSRSRVRHALAMALLLALVAGPTSTLASSPGGSCPSAASGWERVSYGTGPETDGWWNKTVDVGFGGDVDAAVATLAPLLGTAATLDEVYAGIVAGVEGVDRNTNGYICWQQLPTTPGIPPFLFNVTDDSRSSDG